MSRLYTTHGREVEKKMLVEICTPAKWVSCRGFRVATCFGREKRRLCYMPVLEHEIYRQTDWSAHGLVWSFIFSRKLVLHQLCTCGSATLRNGCVVWFDGCAISSSVIASRWCANWLNYLSFLSEFACEKNAHESSIIEGCWWAGSGSEPIGEIIWNSYSSETL